MNMLIDGLPLANRDTGHRDAAGNLYRLRVWHPMDGTDTMLPKVAMVTIEAGAASADTSTHLWRSIRRTAIYDINADSILLEQRLPHDLCREVVYRVHTGIELATGWERITKDVVIALIVPGGLRHAK